jgi:streptomycin 6-kinase
MPPSSAADVNNSLPNFEPYISRWDLVPDGEPKLLLGERTFDYVNILRNPDIVMTTAPGRLARQAAVITEAANLDRTRLLQWTFAFAGLSAAWILGDGDEPALDMAVAEIARGRAGEDRVTRVATVG